MKKKFILSSLILILAVCAFYFILLHLEKPKPVAPPPSPPSSSAAAVQPASPPVTPTTHYPVATTMTESGAQEQLPSLQDSDRSILGALSAILNKPALVNFLSPDGFIRRFAATIDNLPRETIAVKLRPVKPAEGEFLVDSQDGAITISPKNTERYKPYVELMQSVDSKKLVKVYVRFYPLFQQAYQDLGYPNGYFNDRLIAVIDHLLACPDAPSSLRLQQPHVSYQFADPNFEHMSAGDKILFRIGIENAKKVKHKLREIRGELVANSAAIL